MEKHDACVWVIVCFCEKGGFIGVGVGHAFLVLI